MKLKIKSSTIYLLKQNTICFIIVLILILLSFFIPRFLLNQYANNNQKIENLKKNLSDLENKKRVIVQLNQNSAENLDEDAKLLNLLIPQIEDYFSIISTLDTLSQKTGFLITSYVIDLKNSGTDKLVLNIHGLGDQKSFLKFLNEYNVGGGRLITSEKMEYNSASAGGTSLSMTFYTAKVNVADKNQATSDINFSKFTQELKNLKGKVDLSLLESSSSENLPQDYPKKTNPF